jgi:Zn finger protein HypA/HybF involved in hydrogenase expression
MITKQKKSFLQCSKCGKTKTKTEFRANQKELAQPICRNCQEDFRVLKTSGLKVEKIKSTCMMCGESFFSVNNKRTCTRCSLKKKRLLKNSYFI